MTEYECVYGTGYCSFWDYVGVRGCNECVKDGLLGGEKLVLG